MSDKLLKQPERSDIPEEFRWDLSPLYDSDDAWERDFALLDSLLKASLEFKGKLADSPSSLRAALEQFDELYRTLDKLYTFAHLKSDEDVTDSENLARLGRAMSKHAEIAGALAWFEPEVLAIPEDAINAFMESEELAFYRRTLKEILRDKPHTLSESEERILGLAADALHSPAKVFSAMNDADAKFPVVPDGKGGEVELTHGNYQKLLESPSREARAEAFNAMQTFYREHRNSFAATLEGTVKTHILNANLRSFPSPLAAALHSDNVSVEIYDNLISTVRSGLAPFAEHLEFRAKKLGLEKLDMYDLRAPIVDTVEKSIAWDEAIEMVMSSLAPLGDEYVDTASKAFSERWVDSRESRGKRSGAYSSGCYDSPPYILMNFNGTLNDVFTLAHELGHSIHSLFSRRAQKYHYADYKIFVAEVASTTNELLLHENLIRDTNDKSLKAFLSSHLLDTIRGTLLRQTMFAEFEKLIHEMLLSDGALTADKLSEKYYELNAAYHPGIDADKLIAVEWARIPHFHYNFYVYKYATGISAAATLSKKLLEGGQTERDAYLGFLRAGSTRDVLDILRDAGVDLASPAPVENALELLASTAKILGDD